MSDTNFKGWVTSFLRIPLGIVLAAGLVRADETRFKYLSGHGPKDAVPWEFTVTKGRRAGEHTTIPVPAHWDQQGFGSYDYGNSPGAKSDEHGLYRTRFSLPAEWKERRVRLVFEGVMTDAEVKVNGQLAGPVHQGGFNRFRYEITSLLKEGEENILEVDVSKVSANPGTERAERRGDYWIFGGIYRPVYLEAVPAQFIDQISIDAGADGLFKAEVDLGTGDSRVADRVDVQILTTDGKPVGKGSSTRVPGGDASRIGVSMKVDSPKTWTAETPDLYKARFTLMKGSLAIHTMVQRFGFRTITVRKGEGIFVNGKRILLKGVCRHSFRPETGRTLDTADCLEDIRMIKAMNMNAVRMSHYPPDVAFLDACDELGLYVLDELSGWQKAHDTENGRKLVKETVTRDVNHPSILFWDNGNEGGWNRELDGDFALYDPQNRLVLHPWEIMNGVDTKHYPTFEDLSKRLSGENIVMPTEMIHGLYDGGAGSGLEDYWNAIRSSPVGGGGFIWVFADEGIMRTDQNNRIDVFSTYAPDGILGPRHEKKGSYYTVRDVFSPVQVDAPALDEKFSGTLDVHNRYDFVSLEGCRFDWKLLRFPDPRADMAQQVLVSGQVKAPAIAAGASGKVSLKLPSSWRGADALCVTAVDTSGKELWTWVWPTPALARRLVAPAVPPVPASTRANTDEGIELRAGDVSAIFDEGTGLLRRLSRGGKTAELTNGPRVVFARPAAGEVQWTDAPGEEAGQDGRHEWRLEAPRLLNLMEIELEGRKDVDWAGFKLEISSDGKTWKVLYDATRRTGDGNRYEFPPQQVSVVRLSNLRQADGKRPVLKRLRAAYQTDRFPVDPGQAKVSSGGNWLESTAANGTDRFRWTMDTNGDLRLDYSYQLDGGFIYHGVTFDHPESGLKSVKWLGQGPARVWQNRLRGTTLGVHEIVRNDIQPGESWTFPEFQGYFAGLRWASLETTSGPLTISAGDPETYLRIGTPRISHPLTSVSFPAGDLSFLKAIPAMGSKFIAPAKSGPSSQPVEVSGLQSGSLVFHLGE